MHLPKQMPIARPRHKQTPSKTKVASASQADPTRLKEKPSKPKVDLKSDFEADECPQVA